MATNMSDELRDETEYFVSCEPCLKVNTNVAAKRYCVDCAEHLCGSCLSIHNRLSKTSGHDVTDISPVLVPKDMVSTLTIHRKPSDDKCEINGLCTFRRGNHFMVVLTEWSTKCIMLFDLISNTHVDSLNLRSSPFGVSYLHYSGYIVVGLYDAGEVAIIEMSPQFKLTIYKYVAASNLSRGIEVVPEMFGDSLLMIGSGAGGKESKVDVYSVLTDTVEFYRINTFGQTSSFLLNVAVGVETQNIYLTDKTEGVEILNRRGRHKGHLTHPILKGACAICTDNEGSVYVAGIQSANIVKFDCDGQFVGEVANKSHGLVCPISLCFDDVSTCLIVGSKNDPELKILQLR